MAELKDSGARRAFDTGAVRDIAEGKGRCDLLPLGVASNILDEGILDGIDGYVRTGETSYLYNAIAEFIDGAYPNTPTALLEVSHQYEDGCQKYGERNWELGQPLHCYIDSAVRHYLKFLRGDTDEHHDRAVIWNLLGAIWTHDNRPEMIDLPFACKEGSHNA